MFGPSSSSKPSSFNSSSVAKLKRRSSKSSDVGTCVSPYYKGLIDQSLAINKEEFGSQSHHHQHNHLNSGGRNNSKSRVPATTSEPSPYYRALTDFSLDIHGGQHLQAHDCGLRTHKVEGPYKCSPCFRGLIDCSLATAIRKLDLGRGGSCGHGGVVPINLSSLVFNMNLCLGGNDDRISNDDITAPTERQCNLSALSPPRSMFPSKESSSNKDVPHEEIKEEEGSMKAEYVRADKYQPKSLQEFICHKHIVYQLLTMIKEGCVCDHFIFEGPPGVGKRTMIRALLREVFGHDEVNVTEEYRTYSLKGEVIQLPIIKSEHHVEFNLSQTKGYKEQVVADLLRETYDKIINISMPCEPKYCQAIIIYEAEALSTVSLLYIKWMLERHNNGCNKVFFCCSDESQLQIVKPLCKTFRLSPPSTQEIVGVLEYIGKREGKELSHEFLTKVVEKSKNNLRQAIRSLEATCKNNSYVAKLELRSKSSDVGGTCVSSYYKGLIDQSLAINKEEYYGSQNHLNSDYKSCLASPYYRGLL